MSHRRSPRNDHRKRRGPHPARRALFAAAAVALSIAGCATSPRDAQAYEGLLAAAQLAISSNHPDSALPDLQAAIRLNGRDYRPRVLSGTAYEMLHEYSRAARELTVARSLAPGVKEIPFNLGNNYFALGQYPAAIDAYSQAIAVDSTFSKPYLNRANAYLNLQDLGSALRDYKRYQEVAATPREDVALMIGRLEAYLAVHPGGT